MALSSTQTTAALNYVLGVDGKRWVTHHVGTASCGYITNAVGECSHWAHRPVRKLDITAAVLEYVKYERSVLSQRAGNYQLLAETQLAETGDDTDYVGLSPWANREYTKIREVR